MHLDAEMPFLSRLEFFLLLSKLQSVSNCSDKRQDRITIPLRNNLTLFLIMFPIWCFLFLFISLVYQFPYPTVPWQLAHHKSWPMPISMEFQRPWSKPFEQRQLSPNVLGYWSWASQCELAVPNGAICSQRGFGGIERWIKDGPHKKWQV